MGLSLDDLSTFGGGNNSAKPTTTTTTSTTQAVATVPPAAEAHDSNTSRHSVDVFAAQQQEPEPETTMPIGKKTSRVSVCSVENRMLELTGVDSSYEFINTEALEFDFNNNNSDEAYMTQMLLQAHMNYDD